MVCSPCTVRLKAGCLYGILRVFRQVRVDAHHAQCIDTRRPLRLLLEGLLAGPSLLSDRLGLLPSCCWLHGCTSGHQIGLLNKNKMLFGVITVEPIFYVPLFYVKPVICVTLIRTKWTFFMVSKLYFTGTSHLREENLVPWGHVKYRFYCTTVMKEMILEEFFTGARLIEQ